MNPLTLGFVGLYLMVVIIRGNGQIFRAIISDHLQKFLPTLVAALLLYGGYQSDKMRPFIGPFIWLAIISLSVRNIGTIKTQLTDIYSHYVYGKNWAPVNWVKVSD
jgi:hypothetical protein